MKTIAFFMAVLPILAAFAKPVAINHNKVPGNAQIVTNMVEVLKEKRDVFNYGALIPRSENWTWSSTDPNCPAEFLKQANFGNAPRPVWHPELEEWGNVCIFWPNGRVRYQMAMNSLPEDTLTLTITVLSFKEDGTPDTPSSFAALATRESATDRSLVATHGNEFIRITTTDIVMDWLSGKADRSDTYTKGQVDAAIADHRTELVWKNDATKVHDWEGKLYNSISYNKGFWKIKRGTSEWTEKLLYENNTSFSWSIPGISTFITYNPSTGVLYAYTGGGGRSTVVDSGIDPGVNGQTFTINGVPQSTITIQGDPLFVLEFTPQGNPVVSDTPYDRFAKMTDLGEYASRSELDGKLDKTASDQKVTKYVEFEEGAGGTKDPINVEYWFQTPNGGYGLPYNLSDKYREHNEFWSSVRYEDINLQTSMYIYIDYTSLGYVNVTAHNFWNQGVKTITINDSDFFKSDGTVFTTIIQGYNVYLNIRHASSKLPDPFVTQSTISSDNARFKSAVEGVVGPYVQLLDSILNGN